MVVLVSDTSVVIDLDRARLLETLFRLPAVFAVPDLLFSRELTGDLGRRLEALGLQVHELSAAEVTAATRATRADRSLSLPDAFAFALGQGRGWELLTGDGGLRRWAEAAQVTVHGVLWVFDELERHAACAPGELHQGLSGLAGHPRCRLPRAEVNRRLQRWEAS